MSEMRFGIRYRSGGNRDRDKNQAPRLSGLGDVDTACHMHLRSYTYHSCRDEQQNENQNTNSHRSHMSELRKQVEDLNAKGKLS